MAETVTIEGQRYLKRQPLGVLGLSFITLGIYFFYWYYKVNGRSSGSSTTSRSARLVRSWPSCSAGSSSCRRSSRCTTPPSTCAPSRSGCRCRPSSNPRW